MDLEALFGQDLTNVDLTPTLIKDGTQVEMEVVDCKVVDKKDNTGSSIGIWLRTCYQYESNKPGKPIPAGWQPSKDKPTEYIGLNESDKRDAEMILASLKRFRQACGFADGPFGQPSQYVGARVLCKATIEKDKGGQFPDKNRFQWQMRKAA